MNAKQVKSNIVGKSVKLANGLVGKVIGILNSEGVIGVKVGVPVLDEDGNPIKDKERVFIFADKLPVKGDVLSLSDEYESTLHKVTLVKE